jgi:hypothetical protein
MQTVHIGRIWMRWCATCRLRAAFPRKLAP